MVKRIFISNNREKYEGEYLNGEPHGYGVYTYPFGQKYEGQWVNGTENGQGKYIWDSGYSYEGDFANGLRHGEKEFLVGKMEVNTMENMNLTKPTGKGL